MLEQTLGVDEPRPRLRGPLAPVRVVLGAGKGVGQGIGHALERIARRGRGVLASVTAGQLYGDTEQEAVVDECATALAILFFCPVTSVTLLAHRALVTCHLPLLLNVSCFGVTLCASTCQ